jgi:hypothetical protein
LTRSQRRAIPFLAESGNPDPGLSLVQIVAGVTPDDLWLPLHDGDEGLLFRTRSMTNMLWCD